MKKKIKTYTLKKIKDDFIGKKGAPERVKYEEELKQEIALEKIKQARKNISRG